MQRLAIVVSGLSFLLLSCSRSASRPPAQYAENPPAATANDTAQYLTPLLYPEIPPGAPEPQFVTTDIASVDYLCQGSNGRSLPAVTGQNYPGRALKLCAKLQALSSIASVIASNILSNCLPPAPVLAGPTADLRSAPFAGYAISGIRAYDYRGEPAHVVLTGIPCPAADALNP
jgi:hypothetical protein